MDTLAAETFFPRRREFVIAVGIEVVVCCRYIHTPPSALRRLLVGL